MWRENRSEHLRHGEPRGLRAVRREDPDTGGRVVFPGQPRAQCGRFERGFNKGMRNEFILNQPQRRREVPTSTPTEVPGNSTSICARHQGFSHRSEEPVTRQRAISETHGGCLDSKNDYPCQRLEPILGQYGCPTKYGRSASAKLR